VRRAAELNQRPITLIATYHKGSLPQKASFVSVDQANVVVSVIKKAEDNDDLIVRCYETAKIQTQATIHVQDRAIETTLGPCEIKTFRIPKDRSVPIVETNLLEWNDVPTP
jgi:alpha-mannosidase